MGLLSKIKSISQSGKGIKRLRRLLIGLLSKIKSISQSGKGLKRLRRLLIGVLSKIKSNSQSGKGLKRLRRLLIGLPSNIKGFSQSGKELKRLSKLLEQYRATENEWNDRALAALKQEQEDLARQAIVFKLRAQKGAARIEAQMSRLTKGKLKIDTTALQAESQTESWVQLENMVRMNKEFIASS